MSDLIRLLILPHNVSDKELVLGVDQMMHRDFEAKVKFVMASLCI